MSEIGMEIPKILNSDEIDFEMIKQINIVSP